MKKCYSFHKILASEPRNFEGQGREGFAGNFGWGKTLSAVLYSLSAFDTEYLRNVPLSGSEVILRYDTDLIRGNYSPLIKVDAEKGRVYFLTQDSFDGLTDDPEFEARGVNLNFLSLI